MPDLFSATHISDLMTLLWMLLALTLGYRSRVKPWACAALLIACLTGGFGSILVQEMWFPHFAVYMLLFVLWGCVYGAVALRGALPWKAAMVSVYGCVVFQLGKCAALVDSWLPASWRQPYTGFILFQLFAVLAAVFLSCHAVTTERKVPAVCWVSLMAVSLIGIWFAYYQMSNDPGPASVASSALYSVGVVAIVMIVEHLCARVIRSHERDLVRLSLEQGSKEQAVMARQASRTEEALRRYRHETANHLSTLSALLSAGETQQAQALIAEMTAAPAALPDDFHSGNPLVDAIFSQKKADCQQLGIDFSADLVLTEQLPLTDAEISSLLGNLLNNAMEAARSCEAPFVHSRMYPARNYLCIEVVNRADESKLRSNPALNTTKGEPELHGIGLKVVQEIASRHQGMTYFGSEQPGQFTARVMIRL